MVLIQQDPGQIRVALLDRDQQVIEVLHERPGLDPVSRAGAVVRGRVRKIDRDLNAAFIDLGDETDGFLGFNDAKRFGTEDEKAKSIKFLMSEGDRLLVQVDRDGYGAKGPKLTRRLQLGGRYIQLRVGNRGLKFPRFLNRKDRANLTAVENALPPGLEATFHPAASGARVNEVLGEMEDLVIRLKALTRDAGNDLSFPPSAPSGVLALAFSRCAPEPMIVTNTASMAARIHRHMPDADISRPPSNRPLFEGFGVEDVIQDALAPQVMLTRGGRMTINETPALTAIDIDTAAASGGGGTPAKLAREVNMAAVKRLAREFRLRNIGGQIIIDVVPMKSKKDRQDVLTAFKQALEPDPNECHVLGYTGLGLIELTRRRMGASLARRLLKAPEAVPSPGAEALARLAAAVEAGGASPRIRASRAVIGVLKGSLTAAVKEAEAQLGAAIVLEHVDGGGDD